MRFTGGFEGPLTSGKVCQPELYPLIEAILLYNPYAGRVILSEKRRKMLQERLYCRGIRTHAVSTPADPTFPLSLDFTDRQLLIVYGGDGTIRQALESAVVAGVPMAVLPAGTVNLLAREMGIPLDPERAADLVGKSRRRIFLGQGNGHYFHHMAGIGLDAFVVQQLPAWQKRAFGAAAYGMTALTALWRYPMPSFEICLDDGERQRATFALVANSPRYGGGFRIVPKASLYRDSLDVCLFTSRCRLRFFVYLWGVLWGRHLSYPDVIYRSSRHLEVGGETTVPVQLDGEFIGTLPMNFEAGPALEIVVPV